MDLNVCIRVRMIQETDLNGILNVVVIFVVIGSSSCISTKHKVKGETATRGAAQGSIELAMKYQIEIEIEFKGKGAQNKRKNNPLFRITHYVSQTHIDIIQSKLYLRVRRTTWYVMYLEKRV